MVLNEEGNEAKAFANANVYDTLERLLFSSSEIEQKIY
jgi:hypothetical protein